MEIVVAAVSQNYQILDEAPDFYIRRLEFWGFAVRFSDETPLTRCTQRHTHTLSYCIYSKCLEIYTRGTISSCVSGYWRCIYMR